MLLGHFRLRYGTPADVERCQQIARQFRAELPFVMLPQLRESARRRELFVAELDGKIVGFVRWHARRDGWQTVYDLAVSLDAQGLGVGRALLYAVPTPLRLKCTVDNEPGNTFYAGAGMQLIHSAGTEAGAKRALNVWELRLLTIFCAGRNKAFPQLARQSGMAYGTRHDYAPTDWPYMLDIAWTTYDWQDYMDKVTRWQPVQAMVADYERPAQRETMLSQIADLSAAGVLRPNVCPKFEGAVADIPAGCVVALSVPSRYAGWLPANLGDLRRRRVHLLGGTPHQQLALIPQLQAIGAHVLSVDGSSHESAAKKGSHFEGGKWRRNAYTKADYHHTIVFSGRNIVRQLNAAAQAEQPPLL